MEPPVARLARALEMASRSAPASAKAPTSMSPARPEKASI
jgi:hypothetical protein